MNLFGFFPRPYYLRKLVVAGCMSISDEHDRIVEPTLGVMCGSMPYLAAFWRHQRASTTLVSSVKRLFTRLTNLFRGSQISAKPRSHRHSGAESSSSGQGNRVETKVLGSIQGHVSHKPTQPASSTNSVHKERQIYEVGCAWCRACHTDIYSLFP